MATKLPSVDVLFVGFGLVGSAIAAELAQKTSLKMVALERGPYRDTFPDFIQDHFDEWRFAVQSDLFQDLSRNTITFRNNGDQTATPMREYGSFLPGNGVGGAMVHWNGQVWRFLEHFFEYRTHLEERYGKDFLPEDTTIQDWPVSYADLEPFYTQFDDVFGISGKAGNLNGEIQPGGNPFEGPRSKDYPQAPGKLGYAPTLFSDAATNLGYHPFYGPSGNSSGAYTNPYGLKLGPCNYCGFCERFGCHTGAKSSPILMTVPAALASGNLEIRQYATVFKINHKDGKASSVSYYDANGNEVEQPADLIIVGAWTIENMRLMMLSQIGEIYDPATGKGTVGRNYTYQLGGASATVWFEDKIMNRFMGSGAGAVVMDDFNGDNFDHTGLGFFGGGSISSSQSGARPIQSNGPLPPDTPGWGSDWKAAAAKWYNRSMGVGMQAESAAYRQNHADLDPIYKDAWGNPLLRITFDWTDNERKLVEWIGANVHQKIADELGGTMQVVNNKVTNYSIVPYQSTHVQGGTVMGSDPSN
ncbi:MAG: GMC family oxidoreductase N-terminal domain-containing protein, partial [Thermomicrobiales bacterium]